MEFHFRMHGSSHNKRIVPWLAPWKFDRDWRGIIDPIYGSPSRAVSQSFARCVVLFARLPSLLPGLLPGGWVRFARWVLPGDFLPGGLALLHGVGGCFGVLICALVGAFAWSFTRIFARWVGDFAWSISSTCWTFIKRVWRENWLLDATYWWSANNQGHWRQTKSTTYSSWGVNGDFRDLGVALPAAKKEEISYLFPAALLGTFADRTAKMATKAILVVSVWHAYMPSWTADLTI